MIFIFSPFTIFIILFPLIISIITQSTSSTTMACLPPVCSSSTKRDLMENGLQKQSSMKSIWEDGKAFFGFKGEIAPVPSKDPFYGCNTTLEKFKTMSSTAPGTLLRKRGIYLTEFPGFDADDQIGWQIAYITRGQDPIKDIQITVATIVIPPNAGKRDKIIFQFPKSDSANANCRTSYSLNRASGQLIGAASEQIFMIDYLKRGYIVVVVDYEGQFDAFGAGLTAGHAALDSMRAILQFKELKVAPKESLKFIGWGYSGGAIAVTFAAQMIQTYAPELIPFIKGWSTGGIPIDLTQVAYHVNDHMAAGLIIGVMQGLSNIYPNLTNWLESNMNKEGKDALLIAKTKCFWSFMSGNAFKDVLFTKVDNKTDQGYFTIQGDPLSQSIPKSILQENQLGFEFQKTKNKNLIPKIPMFIYESIDDEVVPIQIVDDLVKMWSDNGANIQYTKVKVWLHVGTIFAMQSQNVQWIQDRMDGKPIASASSTTEIDTKIDDCDSNTVLGKARCKALAAFYKTTYDGKSKPPLW